MVLNEVRKKLQEMLSASGNINLVVHQVYSPIGDYREFIIKCTLCGESAKWKVNDIDVDNLDLGFFDTMCEIHRHEDVKEPEPLITPALQNLVGLNSFTTTNVTPMTVTSTTDFNMMGDLQIKLPGQRTSQVSVSQELLKWVARTSNFNVDLQAQVAGNICTNYRVICGRCNQFMMTNYAYMISPQAQKPGAELEKFCRAHRHDATIVEEVTGRKFRGN